MGSDNSGQVHIQNKMLMSKFNDILSPHTSCEGNGLTSVLCGLLIIKFIVQSVYRCIGGSRWVSVVSTETPFQILSEETFEFIFI